MPRPTWHSQLLDQYETLTNSYRRLDYQAGSGAVYAEAVLQLNRMLLLIRSRIPRSGTSASDAVRGGNSATQDAQDGGHDPDGAR